MLFKNTGSIFSDAEQKIAILSIILFSVSKYKYLHFLKNGNNFVVFLPTETYLKQKTMSYNTFTLPNGLRIIHAPNQSNVAYCGFAVDAGTRDENEQEQGMAHFVEHLIFKGTQKDMHGTS